MIVPNYEITAKEQELIISKLEKENKQLRDVLNKAKYKIKRKIAFCSCEEKGHINHEKCNKTILFLKDLLDDLKEVQ